MMPSKVGEIEKEPELKQSEMLYNWSQTDDQITISFQVKKSFKPKDAKIDIQKDTINVQLINEPLPRIKGKLFATIDHFDSMWQVENESKTNKRVVTIHIEKLNTIPWPIVIRSGVNGAEDIEGMDHQSQYLCGSFYQAEVGDYEKAFKYFESAANLGNISAQMKLAAFYELGKNESQSIIVDQDHQKAIYWHTKAAEADNPEACYIVGTAYQQGTHFLKKSYSTAFFWFERCLNANPDLAEIANNIYVATCFQIGLMKLEGGFGLEEDSEGAIKYWKMSAFYKHAQSLYNLGVLYLNNIGKDHNIVKAIRLINEAITIDSTLDVPAQLQQLSAEQLEQVTSAAVQSHENPELEKELSLENILSIQSDDDDNNNNNSNIIKNKSKGTTTTTTTTSSTTTTTTTSTTNPLASETTTNGSSETQKLKHRKKKKSNSKHHHHNLSKSTSSKNNKLIMATGLVTLAGISAFVIYRILKRKS